MGYYVQITQTNLKIEASKKEEILKCWKKMNEPQFNHLKSGGSYGSGVKTASWYSWMDENYHELVSSTEEVLEQLGFEFETLENGDIELNNYDGKTGQEDLFFSNVAHLINPGQYVYWKGEDDAKFAWIFDGNQMIETSKKEGAELIKKMAAAIKLQNKLNKKLPLKKELSTEVNKI